jgi:DNA-binding NtrC family response regulator
MGQLEGVRVLLVEDEALVLLELQDLMADMGAVIAGSAAVLRRALELAHRAEFDVAILDVNLGAERSDSVAAAVAERNIPIVFATGYGADALPRFIKGGLLEKPYNAASLEAAVSRALAERAA